MAIARLPGSLVEIPFDCDEELPAEEAATWVVRVLSSEEWRRVIAATNVRTEAGVLLSAKKILGAGLENVLRLRVLDGEGKESMFHLTKVGRELTDESLSVLFPYLEEGLEKIRKAHTFTRADAKN